MPYMQNARSYIFSSPLGEDLMLEKFRGKETLSQLFSFTLDLISEREDIDPARMLGAPAALRIEMDNAERHWSGRIASFSRTGQRTRFTSYQCEIVPDLWFLLHHEDTRHFQQKSIPDIVDQIFGEFGYSDYATKLTGDHQALVYCTQFQESTADFLARIMEQDGLHYYTKYHETHSELIITDNPDNYDTLPDATIRFHYDDAIQEEDCISSLERRHGMRTGRIVLRDYDFERPHTNLEVSMDTLVRKGDNSPYERFIYAPGYTERQAGERLAKLMMEAEEAQHEVLYGTSNVRQMAVGYRFTLEDHPLDELNTEYLILSVEHEGTNNIDDDAGGTTYRNTFSVLPHAVPYRSPLSTHKKRVFGPQTAFVVGPKGEEIHTDAHGRVKIQFHWDRRGRYDERSSCWARVAQSWAGNGWGTFFLPRIGQEVIVQFLEGDPDRPIVTGCVYNGINVPPNTLPDNQTRSTIKTWSTPGGGGFNELSFEDRKDQEQILMHAQRDLTVKVENISAEHTKTKSLKVDEHHSISVDGEQNISVRNDINTGSGTRIINYAKDLYLTCSSDIVTQVASNVMTLASDDTIVIEAKQNLLLQVGPSYIFLSPSYIDIVGPMVNINCDSIGTAADYETNSPVDNALLSSFPVEGETTKNPEANAPPDTANNNQDLDPVARLENDPVGQVTARATTTESAPVAPAAARAQALQAASVSGQPFVEV